VPETFDELVQILQSAPFFDCILNLQLKTENLRRTRNLLLPRLLSGEVEHNSMDAIA
jgi:hypothetical protein